MDRQRAIDLLDNLVGMVEDNQENDYDGALRTAIDALKQPEIVRCGKCKFSCECDDDMSSIIADYTDEIYCSEHDIYLYKDWYCADAERRTDE